MTTEAPPGLLLALRLLRANWPEHADADSAIASMMAIVPSLERVLAASAAWTSDAAVADEAAWLRHALGRYYLDIDLPAAEAAAHLTEAAVLYRSIGATTEADRVEIALAHAEYRGCVASDIVPERYQRGLARLEALIERSDPSSTTWALAQARRSLYRSELGRTNDSADLIAALCERPDVRALPLTERAIIDTRHIVIIRSDPDRLEQALALAEQLHAELVAAVPDTRARADCLNILAITARRIAPARGRPGWEAAIGYRQTEIELTRRRAAEAVATGSSLGATYRLRVSRSLNNAAVLQLQFGAVDEAEACIREAIQVVEEAVSPRIGTRGIRYGVAGWVALARLDFAGAIERFDAGVECAARIGSRKAGMRMSGSLTAQVLAGHDRASIAAARDVLAAELAAKRTGGRSRVCAALGLAGARLGEPEALASFDDAYAFIGRTRAPGEYPKLRAQALHAVALRLLGQDDEATRLADEVAERIEASIGSADHWVAELARFRPAVT